MKVKSVTTRVKIGDGDYHDVVFEQDGKEVKKIIRVSGAMKKIAKARPREVCYQVMRIICEAERDFAFEMFGKKWPEHVGKRGCKAHVDIACDIAEMRPDLFPAWSATNAHQ